MMGGWDSSGGNASTRGRRGVADEACLAGHSPPAVQPVGVRGGESAGDPYFRGSP